MIDETIEWVIYSILEIASCIFPDIILNYMKRTSEGNIK
jgi:hypothetical protein